MYIYVQHLVLRNFFSLSSTFHKPALIFTKIKLPSLPNSQIFHPKYPSQTFHKDQIWSSSSSFTTSPNQKIHLSKTLFKFTHDQTHKKLRSFTYQKFTHDQNPTTALNPNQTHKKFRSFTYQKIHS